MTTVAACHCRGTRISIDTLPTSAVSCTCTYCTKTGGLWAYFPADGPRIEADEHGAIYSASAGRNRHHFCRRCGCQTYGLSPDWSNPESGRDHLALNVRLIEGLDLAALAIETVDGRNLW